MGTTQQKLYTAALTELGERKYLTTERANAVRVLDEVYDDVLEECLSEASWNFAMETIKLEADTGIEPNFGYKEVFAKPSDWLKTIGVSGDEYLSQPLLHYYDDSNYWSADYTPIYVRYVSNDTSLGMDLTRWPIKFTRYVALSLAARACYRLTQDKSLKEQLEKERHKAEIKAKSQDAMDEAQPKFAPPGSWTRSRWGRNGGDRGNRNSLTG